jgi:hypothetical protein
MLSYCSSNQKNATNLKKETLHWAENKKKGIYLSSAYGNDRFDFTIYRLPFPFSIAEAGMRLAVGEPPTPLSPASAAPPRCVVASAAAQIHSFRLPEQPPRRFGRLVRLSASGRLMRQSRCDSWFLRLQLQVLRNHPNRLLSSRESILPWQPRPPRFRYTGSSGEVQPKIYQFGGINNSPWYARLISCAHPSGTFFIDSMPAAASLSKFSLPSLLSCCSLPLHVFCSISRDGRDNNNFRYTGGKLSYRAAIGQEFSLLVSSAF